MNLDPYLNSLCFDNTLEMDNTFKKIHSGSLTKLEYEQAWDHYITLIENRVAEAEAIRRKHLETLTLLEILEKVYMLRSMINSGGVLREDIIPIGSMPGD